MKSRLVRQRGAAILIAMLVVTLVATLAAGLQWRQWRTYSQESAYRTQSQAAWVLVGALDWARLILREDARTNTGSPVDHLGEPWALPLQEAKLSSFLSADSLAQAGQDEAYLSGQIMDAQAKINLTNLLNGDKIAPEPYAALMRLYTQLQLPTSELTQWTDRWLQSEQAMTGTNAGSTATASLAALRPQNIDQLDWLGVSSASIEALRPYITILPSRTPINLNTASALVIYAAVPSIDKTIAEQLVRLRAQTPLQNLEAASKILQVPSLNTDAYSVHSGFFEVTGRLRLGDWQIEERSLVRRIGQEVKTMWRQKG